MGNTMRLMPTKGKTEKAIDSAVQKAAYGIPARELNTALAEIFPDSLTNATGIAAYNDDMYKNITKRYYFPFSSPYKYVDIMQNLVV